MRSYGSFVRTNIYQIRSDGKIAMVSDINFSQAETLSTQIDRIGREKNNDR